jgi:hypothetical protein
MLIQRLPHHFDADPKKVILLYLDPGQSDRLTRFAGFAEALTDEQATALHKKTTDLFGHRHRRYSELLRTHDSWMWLKKTDSRFLILHHQTSENRHQRLQWSVKGNLRRPKRVGNTFGEV